MIGCREDAVKVSHMNVLPVGLANVINVLRTETWQTKSARILLTVIDTIVLYAALCAHCDVLVMNDCRVVVDSKRENEAFD
jgi:predicted nucleic acid-binding protein